MRQIVRNAKYVAVPSIVVIVIAVAVPLVAMLL